MITPVCTWRPILGQILAANTWFSAQYMPSIGQTLALPLSELGSIVKVIIGLVWGRYWAKFRLKVGQFKQSTYWLPKSGEYCAVLSASVIRTFEVIVKFYTIYTLRKNIWLNQKNYLFETLFFYVKKCFVSMKQNLFDSNKISLDQINICSNQINFCLKSNKLYLWPYINALISLFWRKINLIQTNSYLVQRYFVWIKQILFHLNKSFH